tara:strand:+ start:1075 stop:1515 length:441 start_codon:yes stop_codon:yes gene_type:complete
MADITNRLYVEATIEGTKNTVEHSNTVSSGTQVYDQSIPLTTTVVTVLTSGATDEAGGATSDIVEVVLENRDTSNVIDVALSDGSSQHIWFQIPAGKFMVFWNRSFQADSDDAAVGTPTFVSWVTISARAAASTATLRIVAYDDAT